MLDGKTPKQTDSESISLNIVGTLDAIDGKHARRTKRSSPLGQLMDHGCDSMDNFLFCIVLSQAYLFGNSIHTLWLQILIQTPLLQPPSLPLPPKALLISLVLTFVQTPVCK